MMSASGCPRRSMILAAAAILAVISFSFAATRTFAFEADNGAYGVPHDADHLDLPDADPRVSSCGEIPQVKVGGPLRAGDMQVLVTDVAEPADYVTVYLNGVKKGILDTRTTGQGDKLVTVCTGEPIEVTGGCAPGDEYYLRKGDTVQATQSYLGLGGTEIEGCPQSAPATVGTGYNPTGLYVTLSVRETDMSVMVGQDASTGHYDIEWIGGQTLPLRDGVAPTPANKLIQPSPTWQSLTFFPTTWAGHPADSVMSCVGGNGVIECPINHIAAFEGLTFVPEDLDTGPFQVYVDDIGNSMNTPTKAGDKLLAGAEGTLGADYLTSSFDTKPVGTQQVMFRYPDYLNGDGGGGYQGYGGGAQLASPQVSEVDNTQFYPSWYNSNGASPGTGGFGWVTSTQSLRLEWQFSTVTSGRYARITTYSRDQMPSPYYPNPAIRVDKPVTVHLLYLPYDNDSDTVSNDLDNCPAVANLDQADADSDGWGDACDVCPNNPTKTESEGACGCAADDVDADSDGTMDCNDACPGDPFKTAPGACGCGVPDVDADSDSIMGCLDTCPLDPDNDMDSDGICGDVDNCPTVPNPDQADIDSDGTGNACELRGITQWRSVRSHSGADLAIALAQEGAYPYPTSEPRQGGIQRIEIVFWGPITLASTSNVQVVGRTTIDGVVGDPVSYTPSTVTLTDANTVAIAFDPGALPDATCYTIVLLPGLIFEALTGDGDCAVRSLVGDANSSGGVNLGDALYAKSRTGAPLADNAALDVNLSGAIDLDDAIMIRDLVTTPPHEATCP